MGFGLGSVALGLILGGIAAATSASGFIIPALVLGVTIGPILLVAGLIVVIVGAVMKAGRVRSAPADAVVVTGIGAASALGTGIEAHREALRSGRDGLRPVERFDTTPHDDSASAECGRAGTGASSRSRTRSRPGGRRRRTFPLHELALVAAREAWTRAGLTGADPRRTALVFGTCFGHGFREFHAVARAHRGGARGLRGPASPISTACASSTNAIGLGARSAAARSRRHRGRRRGGLAPARGVRGLLRARRAQPGQVRAFQRARRNDARRGRRLRRPRARRRTRHVRRTKAWASIHGYGLSADGFHETTPDPTGRRHRARHPRRARARRVGRRRDRLRQRPRHRDDQQRPHRVVGHRARARRGPADRRPSADRRARSATRKVPRARSSSSSPSSATRGHRPADAALPRPTRRLPGRSRRRARAPASTPSRARSSSPPHSAAPTRCSRTARPTGAGPRRRTAPPDASSSEASAWSIRPAPRSTSGGSAWIRAGSIARLDGSRRPPRWRSAAEDVPCAATRARARASSSARHECPRRARVAATRPSASTASPESRRPRSRGCR